MCIYSVVTSLLSSNHIIIKIAKVFTCTCFLAILVCIWIAFVKVICTFPFFLWFIPLSL